MAGGKNSNWCWCANLHSLQMQELLNKLYHLQDWANLQCKYHQPLLVLHLGKLSLPFGFSCLFSSEDYYFLPNSYSSTLAIQIVMACSFGLVLVIKFSFHCYLSQSCSNCLVWLVPKTWGLPFFSDLLLSKGGEFGSHLTFHLSSCFQNWAIGCR